MQFIQVFLPGKYAASINPRKKRHAIRPAKFWHAPVAPEIIPQIIIQQGR
jgi:hypothetical protein